MRWRYTEEGKRKLSEARKGIPKPFRNFQHCFNLSKALKGRIISEEHRRKISITKKGKSNPSAIGNKNTLGMHHTEFSRRKVSLSKLGIPRSEETKRKVSIGLSLGIAEGRIKINNSKRIRYKEILFRSNWEILFAKELDRLGIIWKYEELLLIPSGGYLPDFFLPECKLYIEIKGYWRDDALRKFIEASQIYSVKLIMEKELKELGILGNSGNLNKEEFIEYLCNELTHNPEKDCVIHA